MFLATISVTVQHLNIAKNSSMKIKTFIHEGKAPVTFPAPVGSQLCLGSCGLCHNGSLIILTSSVRQPTGDLNTFFKCL